MSDYETGIVFRSLSGLFPAKDSVRSLQRFTDDKVHSLYPKNLKSKSQRLVSTKDAPGVERTERYPLDPQNLAFCFPHSQIVAVDANVDSKRQTASMCSYKDFK